MSEAGCAADERARVLHVLGLRFPGPVGLAAGYDRDGSCLIRAGDWGFGFVEIGTVTPAARAEHNPGVGRLAATLRALPPAARRVVVGVNVGADADTAAGHAWRDYAHAVCAVRSCADYVVLNFSAQSARALRDPRQRMRLADLLGQVQQRCAALPDGGGRRTPLLVKWPLDVRGADDAADMAAHAAALGYEGVVAVFDGAAAGGSWESWVPGACRALAQAQQRLAVIAVGGIDRVERALALQRAGAALVQMHRGFVAGGPGLVCGVARAWHAQQVRDWP
ncbi:MAG: hypothetical protein IT532_11125 [Burkholderiales bacterium]|nr:hypothetical protein [Burkholderiales bacterium]